MSTHILLFGCSFLRIAIHLAPGSELSFLWIRRSLPARLGELAQCPSVVAICDRELSCAAALPRHCAVLWLCSCRRCAAALLRHCAVLWFCSCRRCAAALLARFVVSLNCLAPLRRYATALWYGCVLVCGAPLRCCAAALPRRYAVTPRSPLSARWHMCTSVTPCCCCCCCCC